MNTSKLARATFVLDRETSEQLTYVADRMGVSRSALARDVLAEPVAMMAKWVRSVPANVTPSDLERIGVEMQGDFAAFLDAHVADFGGPSHG